MKRKLLSAVLSMAMAASLMVGCGSAAPAQTQTDNSAAQTETKTETKTETPAQTESAGGGKVGVAMPTKDLQRWNQDGANMEEQLKAAGYEVDLQYASNDIATQVSQIENMISQGAQVLVIASIDGDSLGTVLAHAK